MLHFNPTLSDPASPQLFDENMHNVIKSTEDIINDDFENLKISETSPADFAWSPYSRINPSMMMPNHERKPFEVLNQYSRFPNPYQAFSPNQNFSHENRSFSYIQNRAHTKDLENLNQDPLPKLRKASSDIMRPYGSNSTNPILKLSITGPAEFELDEKFIRNLFGRFGSIIKGLLAKNRVAYIVIDDPINALTAQKALNKCYLKDLNITLYVNFCHNFEEDLKPQSEPKLELNLARTPKQHINNGSDKENDSCAANTKKSIYTFSQDLSFLPNTTTKFTCKYEVQIENEKEFRVAQKIIGSRGYNMKKIIEMCQSQAKNSGIIYKPDFLKLRLRGKGSGFKEGPDQKESNEPIHLCVSSRYNDVFETACKLVEELLVYVYKEYETFCKATNRKGNFPLQIKKSESYCGSNSDRQTPESCMDMFTSPNNFNAYASPNNNNNHAFFSNENYAYHNGSTPSPRNTFGGENMYRQFGQDRMMNCYNEKVQQNPFPEGLGSHLNYH